MKSIEILLIILLLFAGQCAASESFVNCGITFIEIDTVNNTVKAITSEPAVCRYDLVKGDFGAMRFAMQSTGSTSHWTKLSELPASLYIAAKNNQGEVNGVGMSFREGTITLDAEPFRTANIAPVYNSGNGKLQRYRICFSGT